MLQDNKDIDVKCSKVYRLLNTLSNDEIKCLEIYRLLNKDVKCSKVYRLLNTLSKNNLKIHFKFDEGPENGAFKNGSVDKLDKENNVVIFDENVDGKKPYHLENINPDSIKIFKKKY